MKFFIFSILLFLLTTVSFSQVRIIDNKGTIKNIDPSKWELSGTDIYNKDSGGVGIGTSAIPNANAILELSTINKGFLGPRVALTATTSAAPLTAFVNGMMVYNTVTAGTSPNNVTPGYYYMFNNKWVRFGDGLRISQLLAAAETNTIDNLNFVQTWNWSSASTQNPMNWAANALTTGKLLNLSSTSTGLTTGNLLSISGVVSSVTTGVNSGLINVINTAAPSTGKVATIQANSTATSGVHLYANGNVGVNTTTPGFTGTPINTGAAIPTLGVDGTVNATNYTSIYQTLTDAATIYLGPI